MQGKAAIFTAVGTPFQISAVPIPEVEELMETFRRVAGQGSPAEALATFYAAAGFASYQLKDYAAAVEFFKSALTNNPNDAVSQYRLGAAYLALNPPQSLDGFWALARSIQLKIPDSGKVKDYLDRWAEQK